MNHRTKCQIAELLEDTLAAQGLRGTTRPFVWMKKLFGPLFERDVPTNSMSLREFRVAAILYLALLPAVVVGVLLALPFELYRAQRARRHNATARGVLLSGGAAGAGAGAGERLVVNYRIEREGRAVFSGVALAVVAGETRQLAGFTVHRSVPPRDAVDGEAVRSALATAAAPGAELCHWEWSHGDPYALTERGARPW